MNNNKDINNDHDNDNNNRKGFNKQLQKNSRLIFENVTKQSHVSKIQLEVQRFPFPITIIIYDHYYNFYYYYYYYYLKFILLTQRYQNPSSLLLHSLNLFTFLNFFVLVLLCASHYFQFFIPTDLLYFLRFRQLCQISNCAVFILYNHVNLTIGYIWKHNKAFVFAVLLLQFIKHTDQMKKCGGWRVVSFDNNYVHLNVWS